MSGFAGVSNAGLAMRGYNEGESDQQTLQRGKIGLDQLQQQSDDAAAVRKSAADSAASGADRDVTFDDMISTAEKRGDVATALRLRQAKQSIEDEGVKAVVHRALLDPTPGDRPDLVQEANSYGPNRDMKTMTLDAQGNIQFVGKKSGTMNVGTLAEKLGMVKPWEKEIPAGGMYVRGSPGGGPATVIRNDPQGDNFDVKEGVIFNKSKGTWQQVNSGGDWSLGHITQGDKEVPVRVNKKDGTVEALGPGGVRTGLEAKITQPSVPGGPVMITMPGGGIAEFHPATEATPGGNSWLGKNTPGTPAQPASITPVQQDTPPAEGAKKAPDGKWYLKQGNQFFEVIPGPAGAAPASEAAPTSQPAAPATKPAPKAAPVAKAQPVSETEDQLPEVAPANEPKASPKDIAAKRKADAIAAEKTAKDTAKVRRAAETFRSIASSPRMTAEDIPLIKEGMDSGLLTPAEMSKGRKMLDRLQPKTAYKVGGKVEQRYGL